VLTLKLSRLINAAGMGNDFNFLDDVFDIIMDPDSFVCWI
jgi:hypothetical protein